ncbi:IclR family transcriptional regulator [Ramlibacter sp.]|uniref:IclR family transcriptional regulator n=1 Tax=Ramlibacter sp. TaxID=1917967 RepID=UPI003D0A371F
MRNTVDTASTEAARTGTQSIERAVLLLREIASRGRTGWGLRDLAQHTGMGPGTVHRILKCLVDQRLVHRRSTDSRYLIGPLNFELGLSVPSRMELLENVHAVLRKLSRAMPRINAVCFLRSGDDCVCFAREGLTAYTSAATATKTGQRMPLIGVTSGVAMIAAMPAAEGRAVYERNRQREAHLGEAHLKRVDDLLKGCQRDGYGLSEGDLWHGVNSIALAFGPHHDPIGAVAVSAWSGNHAASKLRAVLPELREAAQALADAVDEP